MARLAKGDFIVVDPGKHEVKGMVFTKTGTIRGVFSFPSKMKKVRSFNNTESSSNKQFRLEHNKRKYIVGEGVIAEYDTDVNKTNQHHQRCVYTSVSSLVGNSNETVNLVIGAPTNDFEVDESIEDYKNLMFGDNKGKVELTLNNTPKSFTINQESMEVYPEGMAVLPRAMRKNPGKIHVVDIGGQNVNYRLYDEKGNTLDYFSLDYAGMNKLELYLKQELRFAIPLHSIDITTIDWNNAISNGRIAEIDALTKADKNFEMINFDDSAEFMDEAVTDFINKELITPLAQRSIDLKSAGHAILFTGGGSLRLENYLEKILARNWGNMEVSKTAKWDNCISYAMRYMSKIEKDRQVVTKAVVKIVKETKHPDFEENHNLLAAEEVTI